MNALIFTTGQRIRDLRNSKGLTLGALASKINTSPSLISQLERGGVNPSLSLLKSISDALSIPLSTLLEDEVNKTEAPSHLMNEKERKVLTMEEGVRYSLLSRHLAMDFEFILIEYPPGTSTGKEKYTHEGVECGLLLEGELEVEVGDRIYRMKPGDSITHHSEIPHRTSNKGKKLARGVWVNSKPWMFSTK
jgi:transcriptional regulator with XRE-family HTH domain